MTKAIGEHRRMAHHTLYQVSTATALVEGIYQGAVRVGTVRTHGDWAWAPSITSMARWRSSMDISFNCASTAL